MQYITGGYQKYDINLFYFLDSGVLIYNMLLTLQCKCTHFFNMVPGNPQWGSYNDPNIWLLKIKFIAKFISCVWYNSKMILTIFKDIAEKPIAADWYYYFVDWARKNSPCMLTLFNLLGNTYGDGFLLIKLTCCLSQNTGHFFFCWSKNDSSPNIQGIINNYIDQSGIRKILVS